MKPIISLYDGHDACITVYDPDTSRIINMPFEQVSSVKHFLFAGQNEGDDVFLKTIRDCLECLKTSFDIENDFSYFLFKSRDYRILFNGSRRRSNLNNPLNIIKSDNYVDVDAYWHHDLHAYSAIVQQSDKTCTVLTIDGIGDGECFVQHGFVDGKKIYSKPETIWAGMTYARFGTKCKSISDNTLGIDIAGKLMGLSAYGKVDAVLYDIMLGLYSSYNRRMHKKRSMSDWIDTICEPYNELDIAATAQKLIEDVIVGYVRKLKVDTLILSGGVALNVLVNERLKNKFPQLKIFVPSNPNDAGLSFGIIAFFCEHNNIEFKWDNDIMYSGLPLSDLNSNTVSKYVLTNVDEIVSMLKDGKIFGILQGRSEIGPRALGNRSIICDPSYPDMKDIINRKIKFREDFRPFAPICNVEHVEKYFESNSYDNLESMGYAVKVRSEYADLLKAVTHVDGTARVQTVTRESNTTMWEIINKIGRPLLNTSFNVGGKPIINSLKEAEQILADTQLDNVIVKFDEKLYFIKV